MSLVRRVILGCALLCVTLGAAPALPAWPVIMTPRAADLPARLSSAEFWRLADSSSEPGGTFHSDNFVSNEAGYQLVIPELVNRARRGALYLGVGPEQNFTYMSSLQPSMAFILDIRRGNFLEHLLYKALFEMSADRAEFVGRLFSRERPAGLSNASSVESIFAAYDNQSSTEPLYRANVAAVTDWLTKHHAFPLSVDDLAGIDYIYRTAFYAEGPDLGYQLTGRGRLGNAPTYAELMAADDGTGRQWSYLASEASFAFLKDLQTRNLVVPVVGDFAGPKGMRAIAAFARQHGAVVNAFYFSNVEMYLRQDGKIPAFCANLATLPVDASSTIIRTYRGGRGAGGGMFTTILGELRAETAACVAG